MPPHPFRDVTFLGFLAEGEAEIGLHDTSRALAALEHGALLGDTLQGVTAQQADLHLALARLLLAPTPRQGAEGSPSSATASPSDASRARTLAERAAGEYEKSHQPAAAAAARALASGAPPP